MIRAVLVGASGRMGQAITTIIAREFPDVLLSGAVAAADSGVIGQDLGTHAGIASLGVPIRSDLDGLLDAAGVVIDFSHPSALATTLAACTAARVALLIGTTGLTAEDLRGVETAARSIAILQAPNTSLGVTLLLELVRRSAAALPDFDIDVYEAHHRQKKDAPSGTALALGRAAAQGRGVRLEDVAVTSRESSGARRSGDIGFAVVRAGDIVGEHSVGFTGVGERLVLSHTATDRAIFARGAVTAARWLAGRPPGRYSMAQVLGL